MCLRWHILRSYRFVVEVNFKHLIKEPTCYKNPINPKCIDLMLTNMQRSFQNSSDIHSGLSDFHMMIATVLRSYFLKFKSEIIMYRDLKKFQIMNFDRLLTQKMEIYRILTMLLCVPLWMLVKMYLINSAFKGIVKRAELNKCDVRLVSGILCLASSFKEWRLWHCILTGNFPLLFPLTSVSSAIRVKTTYFYQKKLVTLSVRKQ